jgi:hypothetical protein
VGVDIRPVIRPGWHVLSRGNLWFATGLRSWRTNIAWLALDDPDEARRQVEQANRQWSREGFHLQHYYELLANGQIDLYIGNGKAGLDRTEQHWKALSSSLLLRVQNIRIEAQHLRARCALAQGLVDIARKAARTIESEKMPWATAIARLIDANVAVVRGDKNASDALATAEKALTAADMHLYAAVARYRRGAPDARAELEKLGARNPSRIADMVMPAVKT